MRIKQTIAVVLAGMAAVVGSWATVAPYSFYSSFPGGGRHWVAMLGPYDEHLVRDVGGLYLTLLVISSWAAIRPRPETFSIVGWGWLAFSVPHLYFHLNHLSGMSTADRVANVGNLAGTVALAIALVVPLARRARPARRRPTSDSADFEPDSESSAQPQGRFQ